MDNNFTNVDDVIYSCLNLDKPESFFLFAGAGSGKTGTLVKVLQRFRDENVQKLCMNGQRVAIITYTNAACDEIKRRLEFDSSFMVSTIHSFCWEMIQTFQADIREWLGNNLKIELNDLKSAQSRARGRNKTFIDREKKIHSKRKRLEDLSDIRLFTYNPNSTDSNRGSLNHAEVIKIASEFLDSRNLMQKLLVRKYPILLVDESQDTKKELIEALFKIQPIFSSEFSLGLFGDTMQRIYTDGKKDLGEKLPSDWVQPRKNINYRCPKRVITLINKIRGDQPQEPGDKNEDGTIRLFIVDSSTTTNKIKIEQAIAKKMADCADDANWCTPEAVKTLTLEHKMAAKRGGFLELFQPLYDNNKNRTGLMDGTMTGMPFLLKKLLPLVNAIIAKDDFRIADLVKSNSPLLDKNKLRQIQEQLSPIQKAKKAVDELCLLWSEGANPLLIDVVKKVYDLEILNVPDVLLPIMQRTDDYSDAPDGSDEEDKNSDLDAWDIALQSPFSQLTSYDEYVSDKSRFGTHQGIKGLEFLRVMVILDDEEAGGFQFSYGKLFGAEALSDTDKKNEKEGNDSTPARTRRLFYVTCSRAEKSLAVVAYTSKPKEVKEFATSQGWFSEAEIEDIFL